MCELWSGKEIVRQFGQPDMRELILGVENGDICVLDLQEAVADGWLQETSANRHDGNKAKYAEGITRLSNEAPNLALNIKDCTLSKTQLRLWALFGILLQSATLILPGLATYRWKWTKEGSSVASYAYPFFLVGSCAVMLEILFCSHVIEAITVERTFEGKRSTRKDGFSGIPVTRRARSAIKPFIRI